MSEAYDIKKVSVPRVATLLKSSQGYGFNLHGDKTQPGQTISAVDKDSPAEQGGLREGDRLIEVNECNVENMTHGDVVKKIKENPNETRLLVCDRNTLAYLKANNRACTVDMANLVSVVVTKPAEEAVSVPPIVVNGDAKPAEVVVESSTAAVEESTPPPAHEPEDTTTPDEVKELNSLLDEQDSKPEEPSQPQPIESVPEPTSEAAAESAPTEPPKPAEPEPTPETASTEPAASASTEPAASDPSGLHFDMSAARHAGKKKRDAAKAGGWSEKVTTANLL